MTEKRYTHNILGSVFKDGEVFALTDGECQAITLCIELNELNDENEQLKKQLTDCQEKKQQMKEFFMNSETVLEQKELQKLIYRRVINLIDEKIKEYKKYDGYDTEKYYIGTGLLKELKRELGDFE